jgi:dipeptidyl-peptidase 4
MVDNKFTHTIGWNDYQKAESFLPWNVFVKAFNVRIQPNWIPVPNSKSCQFWYVRQTRRGEEFILVDVEHKTLHPVLDYSKLVAAISEITGSTVEQYNLPSNIVTPQELFSPDHKMAVYTKQHNLWVRSIPAGDEYSLTEGGGVFDDYASRSDTNGIAAIKKMKGETLPPVVVWSPDSKKLLTHRLNQKEVKEIVLVQSVPADGSVRALPHSFHYPLPGDEKVGVTELIILDVEKRTQIKIQYKPQRVPFLYTTIESGRAWWSEDSTKIYFLFSEPGDKVIRLCEADARTGKTRVLVEEISPTHIDINLNVANLPNIRVVNNGAHVIWFSERDGWGHLYLYDGNSGQLIKQITQGAWVVRDILYIDKEHELIYFTAGGREINRDPYNRFLYRISFYGDNLTLLTPEDGDHTITFSPTGAYFIDTYSRVDTVPATIVRDCEGNYLLHLEDADLGQILDMGWRQPERFCVKDRDGKNDLYGLLYYPTSFDPSRKYPILDDAYPGPQSIRTAKAFPQDPLSAIDFWGPQAISELGFLVITMDGLGTPLRSKAFHDISYGNLGDAGGLEDHIAGIRQLASGRAYMDLDRVGIYGHSGGGFASARALLRFPDFFKVAVSSAGNHDQRGFMAGWGEKYQGLLKEDNYLNQINADLAKNLRGKLLLIFGDMDMGVHPALTIQLIDALIKANKDFDLVILPNRDHFYMNDTYFIRKTWDYFVQHLLEQSPPISYKIQEPDPLFAQAVYQ